MKITDVFHSTQAATATARDDFSENWKFVGTLGAKVFYPVTGFFGIGAFLQGSCNFSNFTDEVAGTINGAPFFTDLKVKYLWDVHFGVAAQATLPYRLKLYGGPFVYYSEADAYFSLPVAGIQGGDEKIVLRNKSSIGGFCGADIPLAKGFRLTLEGQYTNRFSAGAAITYTY